LCTHCTCDRGDQSHDQDQEQSRHVDLLSNLSRADLFFKSSALGQQDLTDIGLKLE